jgi:integrase/recombinase XerC
LKAFKGDQLLQTFLGGRSKRTLRAYQSDLQAFRAFLELEDPAAAVEKLIRSAHGRANSIVLEFRAHLLRDGLSPATINRRLATLRSLVKQARMLGMVPWTLDVPNIRRQPYRDTRGPGRAGFERMVAELERRSDPRTLRDRAAVRMLFDLALRRAEVVSLDLEHVDLEAGNVSVLGKGRSRRELLTLPPPTRDALADWIVARGRAVGPLFVNFDRATKGARLTGRSLHRIVVALGRGIGQRVTPHGLRHAAITEALDLTNGNVRAVQRFSRHRDLRVLSIYDDSRADLGGQVACLVATGGKQ